MSGIVVALATPDLPRKTPATARQFRPWQSSRKGNVMWKKYLSWLIATLLLVIPVAPTANAQPQKEKAVPSILGEDEGKISSDGRTMSGTGQDALGGQFGMTYQWSFSK